MAEAFIFNLFIVNMVCIGDVITISHVTLGVLRDILGKIVLVNFHGASVNIIGDLFVLLILIFEFLGDDVFVEIVHLVLFIFSKTRYPVSLEAHVVYLN